MKKFTAEIETKNNNKRVIAVWLDDETAQLLNECGDESIKNTYIVEEYKAQLIERKETRRHQSLERMGEKGFEIVDNATDVEEIILHSIDLNMLRRALKLLEPQQKWLLFQIYVNGKSKKQIADELGVCKSAISNRLHKICTKLKKFLI